MARDAIDERGQTAVDFLVGVGVFVLVLALVFAFVPELFAPFDDDQARPLVADRSADRLVGSLRGADLGPSTLSTDCTLAFFGAAGATGCGFDPAADLPDRAGIADRYHVNVTVERNTTADPGVETLCSDGSDVLACPAATTLAVGPPVPTERGSVSVARRTVYLDGRDATLVVRVW